MNRIKNLEYKSESRKRKGRSKKSEKIKKMIASRRNRKSSVPSRSEKKIEAFKDISNSGESEGSGGSYILIHKNQLLELLKGQTCNICQQNTVSANFTGSYGFSHKISLVCDLCETILKETYTSIRVNNSARQPFHVNKKIVEAMLLMGLGYAGLQRFCMTVDINILSKSVFNSILHNLSHDFEKYKKAVLEVSRQKVRNYYISMDSNLNSESVIDFTVSYDGTYQKRGFSSLYGIGIVIDLYTGLVIDFIIISKFCKMCSVKSNTLGKNSQEFKLWYEAHQEKNECQKNFDGPSTAMEVYAAEVLWKRSVENCKARYTIMLSDGDAKTFKHLSGLEVYGSNVVLKKEECVNHVCKRLCTALKNARQEWSTKGVSLGGRKAGSLTDKMIAELGGYYRNAIVKNAPHVHLMKSAVLATIEHYSATDDTPTHHLCPAGNESWCWYNQARAKGLVPASHKSKPIKLNSTVIEKIRPIYNRLSNNELLEKCVRGGTQNSNESLHHLIWNQCSKSRFQSRSKLEMSATIAVSEFNMGCEAAATMRNQLQENVTSTVVQKVASARDQQRLQVSSRISQATQKRALRKRKATRKTTEASKKSREEDSYAPGAH